MIRLLPALRTLYASGASQAINTSVTALRAASQRKILKIDTRRCTQNALTDLSGHVIGCTFTVLKTLGAIPARV